MRWSWSAAIGALRHNMDMVADITVSGWTSCKTLCVILFSSLRGTLVHEDNVVGEWG